MARPTKLTPEVKQRIVKAVRAGNYAETSARSAGVSSATYYRWMKRGERESKGIYHDFFEEVKRAEAEAEVHAVAVIRREIADGDWRAAAHYLERRHPDHWRKRETLEHEGSGRLVISAEDVGDPKTRKELREITRRIADARQGGPGGARAPG
ncbi:MAG: transposase [Solirubrobacterales bacterium]